MIWKDDLESGGQEACLAAVSTSLSWGLNKVHSVMDTVEIYFRDIF